MTNQIELIKEKLKKMDIDDLRDVAGDDSYTDNTRREARKLVDAYDYPKEGA